MPLSFPLLAWLAAGAQPIPPRPPPPIVVAAVDGAGNGAGKGLRDVPLFYREPNFERVLGSAREMRAALDEAMRAVFDAETAEDLLRLVMDSDAEIEIVGARRSLKRVHDPTRVPYPYRYPLIERLLPSRLDQQLRANDLGALLTLASATFLGEDLLRPRFPNAGRVAFAVLDRSRRQRLPAAAQPGVPAVGGPKSA